MAKLSVNINKVATLRNARGGDNPDVLQAALDCELYGAQGITVHPRPDERHIRRSDVFELAQTIRTELNIEGYPSEEFMDMVCRVRPTQVTLVPDSPEQLTSNAGWDTKRNEHFLTEIVSELKRRAFAPPFHQSRLFNGRLCSACRSRSRRVLHRTLRCRICQQSALGHHSLRGMRATLSHLGTRHQCRTRFKSRKPPFFAQQLPALDEVSIGHALICDALRMGLQPTIQHYLNCLQTGR